ncbi:hypothetical protein IMCC3317_46530 [Kordia antarctica]|uniref:Secretion system C-terminal sorting domain-containing protein n=1 Tax=Kordia antarctica TaxID=1218801 RepID=A0A7L4ZRC0_9FLAO|nr:T9SS type A sorting domain-containing protein [Kordia antarctica]QHI39248.1 hypothetical protein IMCC3317_46530 [Kordia antarctica]
MKTKLLRKILTALTVIFGLSMMQAQVFDFEVDKGGWDAEFKMISADLDATTGRNTLKCVRENNNATLALAPGTATIDPTTKNYLKLVIKNESNATILRVKAITTDGSDNTMQFSISNNDTEFKTYAFDLDSYATWANATTTMEEVKLLFRVGHNATEGAIFIDEIEFFTFNAMPTFERILQNPSFDDVPFGSSIWNPNSGNTFVSSNVTTDSPRTGTQSFRHAFSAMPTATHFVFNDYVHDFGTAQTEDIGGSLWVRVERPSTPGVSPTIEIQGQVRTGTTTVVGSLTTQSQNVASTKTDGTWEKITFANVTPAPNYTTAQFRYGILATNLQAGDIVYVDDLEAGLASTLTIGENTLNKFSIYPNPVKNTLNINSQDAISNVAVYDLLGKMAISSTNVNNTLDVSELSNGVYIIKLTSNVGVSTKRFIKE